jgi:hypothetical protein
MTDPFCSPFTFTPAPTFGGVLDDRARDRSRPEFRLLRTWNLNLVYYFCPLRKLRKGKVNLAREAGLAYLEAQRFSEPVLRVARGDGGTMRFRFPREREVATIICWPDASVWASVGIIASRDITDHCVFVASTNLALPVFDHRVTPTRAMHAYKIAIALAAVTSGLPLPTYPTFLDNHGRSARNFANKLV